MPVIDELISTTFGDGDERVGKHHFPCTTGYIEDYELGYYISSTLTVQLGFRYLFFTLNYLLGAKIW